MRLRLILLLLFVLCFGLALSLQPARESRQGGESRNDNVLTLLLGDTRKMFANHFFAKADAYFHRGNYPSIFDEQKKEEEQHMVGETHREGEDKDHEEHADHEGHEHHAGPPPARDWIENFGRHFHPSMHVHLEGGEAREMLPWLRIATALDPRRVETYVVTAYWLRERLNKPDEAEQLLREGLRVNPGSPDLLYELGRVFYDSRHDHARARNVWTLALGRWHVVEQPKEKPDELLHLQILSGLVRVESDDAQYKKAIEYLEEMKAASPVPEEIQKRIDALAAKAGQH